MASQVLNRGKYHVPQPVGCMPASRGLEAVGLCCKGTLLAHVQLVVWQDPGYFLQMCYLPSQVSACTAAWGYSITGAGLHTSLIECHEVSVSPFHQLAEVPVIAPMPSRVLAAPLSLLSSMNLLRICYVSSFRLLTDAFNNIAPITTPERCHW